MKKAMGKILYNSMIKARAILFYQKVTYEKGNQKSNKKAAKRTNNISNNKDSARASNLSPNHDIYQLFIHYVYIYSLYNERIHKYCRTSDFDYRE